MAGDELECPNCGAKVDVTDHRCGARFDPSLLAVPSPEAATRDGELEPGRDLHQAAGAGDAEVVRRLLEHGAEVDARDEDGWTPLHRAAGRGRAEVVELLLARGAEVITADEYGRTPLSLALQQGHTEVAGLLRQHGAAGHDRKPKGVRSNRGARAWRAMSKGSDWAKQGLLLGALVGCWIPFLAGPAGLLVVATLALLGGCIGLLAGSIRGATKSDSQAPSPPQRRRRVRPMTRALAWAWFGALAGGAGAAFVMFLGECTPLGYSLRLESEEGPWFLRYVALGASIGGIVGYAVVRLRSLRERRDDCPETAPTGDAQSEGEEGE